MPVSAARKTSTTNQYETNPDPAWSHPQAITHIAHVSVALQCVARQCLCAIGLFSMPCARSLSQFSSSVDSALHRHSDMLSIQADSHKSSAARTCVGGGP